MNELVEMFFWTLILHLSFRGLSIFEKQFVKVSTAPPLIIERQSLMILRKIRVAFCFIAAVEITFIGQLDVSSEQVFVSLVLLFVGLSMRILAIIELKGYWSYHVAIYPNQKRIKTGIYVYLRHPAYLGNIYVIGLFLLFGANYTSIIFLPLLVIFYKYRVNTEERLLQCL